MGRRTRELWLVGLICLGPFALALVAYYGPWDRTWLPQLPGSRELIEPPLAVPELALAIDRDSVAGDAEDSKPRWWLIYAKTDACEAACIGDLERLRQVQLALGRDSERVQRVFVHGADAGAVADEDLWTGRLHGDAGRMLAAQLGEQQLADGGVYLADPQRRLVARYPPGVEQKELLRDLKRLLDVSGVG